MAKAQTDEFQEEEVAELEAPVTTAYDIDEDVELTPRQRNTLKAAKYPFDALQPGQSFHIPATAEQPTPSKTVAGAVTNANTRWSRPDPSGELERRTMATYEKDADGKRVKGPDGSYVKTGEETVERVKHVQDRHFTIRSVGANDPRGVGARVFRDV